MAKKSEIVTRSKLATPLDSPAQIESLIHTIRNQQVMLDRDLALLYGVETRRLNEHVRRNIERFPKDFMFQLSPIEFRDLRSHVTPAINAENQKSMDMSSQIATTFFDGQIFDAYTFVCDLIREAKKQIVLIDNYVDDSVLTMLDKRVKGVKATVYTKTIPHQLSLDIEKHNAQYEPVEIHQFDKAHDRFLCIDETVYHLGASLKDLGKKWFAFSRMEWTATELLEKM